MRTHLGGAFPLRCPLVDAQKNDSQCQWVGPTQDDLVLHILLKHYKLTYCCSACGSEEEDHRCGVTPEMLLNERIMVRWQMDDTGKWFEGLVTAYDEEEGTHLVRYEDKYVFFFVFVVPSLLTLAKKNKQNKQQKQTNTDP